MLAGCKNLSSAIQCCSLGVEHNVIFFFITNVAGLCGWIVSSTPVNYPPADSIIIVFIFQLPDMIAQGGWFLVSMLETGSVLVQSVLEPASRHTSIKFTGLGHGVCNLCPIQHPFRLGGTQRAPLYNYILVLHFLFSDFSLLCYDC